jgi:hypothetical protein
MNRILELQAILPSIDLGADLADSATSNSCAGGTCNSSGSDHCTGGTQVPPDFF